jgi:c-di-GMP-binding flagellar brake protein YcgR
MSLDQRRRSPRHPAGWSASYRLDPESQSRPCRIINVSGDGAAAELYELRPDETPDGRLVLELRSVSGDAAVVEIAAVVRNHARTSTGQIIVGVEFTPLTNHQQELLELLIRLRATA